ncbi:Iron-sulfur flavoprotein [uncultured archaeon]|nr:Iron-sulfur flavoprotein [uncultured archaeon]
MKVLAINSSPMMDKGNTALILDPFLEGMKEEGADVELFYTRKLNINPCLGEFNCWLKTPGKCFQDDDMQMLDPIMREADIIVLATPVYCDGFTGPMKNILDRTVPQVYPFFELREGHCRHPLREGTKASKVVLVSNCGFWEMDNFDPMLSHMKAYCRNGANEFAGALLRPHGGALRPMMEMGAPVDDIFEAAKEAGRQLIRDGRISEKTLSIVSRELIPRDMYVQAVNEHFRGEMDVKKK